MNTKRKILTGVFLILFAFGGLIALDEEFADAFVYWFFIAVIFTALWFMLGCNSVKTADSGMVRPASKIRVFIISFLKSIGVLVLVLAAIIVLAIISGADPETVGRAIGKGMVYGIILTLINSFSKAVGGNRKKYFAKPPEGLDHEYTSVDELRQDLLKGNISLEWMVRRDGQPDYRPISEVLYPAK